MSESAVSDAIHYALNHSHRPSLIFCTTGKVKTSCVVACLRKHIPFRWSTVSAIAGIYKSITLILLYHTNIIFLQ